uniref:hypothetical protein n=1 Tax=Variovorax sp. BK018 TaxID=3450241 RepID=UPI0040396694
MHTMNQSAFKKPKVSGGNPGMGVSLNAAFVRGEEQWTEQADSTAFAIEAGVLKSFGTKTRCQKPSAEQLDRLRAAP